MALPLLVFFLLLTLHALAVAGETPTLAPTPTPWPHQFHSLLIQSYGGNLTTIDLWYDWPNGRNFNIMRDQLGGPAVYDLEWNNGTSFVYTLHGPPAPHCRTAQLDVGILRPNWLAGATYLGRRTVDGFLCDAWTKVDFIWYYEDVATKRPVHWEFYNGQSMHLMTFEVGAALEDAEWQAPAYCFQKNETAESGSSPIVSEHLIEERLKKLKSQSKYKLSHRHTRTLYKLSLSSPTTHRPPTTMALPIFISFFLTLSSTNPTSTADQPLTPAPWPYQFHSLLFKNYSGALKAVDLWYDWPNGRNFNIIRRQLGGPPLYDLEWNNGTSFYYTLQGSPPTCKTRHFDVGILRPDWLDGATYLGQCSVDGFLCNVWEKADFITYFEDVATTRPVLWVFHTGRSMHVMTFEVGAVLADAKWLAPAYCFKGVGKLC